MYRLVMLVALGVIAGATPAAAKNPVYHCVEGTVDNDASAVAYSDVDVSAFSNKRKRTCTFAIGGAVKGGQNSVDANSPISEVFERVLSGDISSLVVRLFIARRNSESGDEAPVEEVMSLLTNDLEALNSCVGALMQSGTDTSNPLYYSEEGALVFLSTENDELSIECSVFKAGVYDLLARIIHEKAAEVA